MTTNMATFSHDPSKKTTTIDHLSRSLERALDEAAYTGEILLSGRKLRDFAPVKCDLSDTITAGQFDRQVLCNDYHLKFRL